jgi:hypothetical protein
VGRLGIRKEATGESSENVKMERGSGGSKGEGGEGGGSMEII